MITEQALKSFENIETPFYYYDIDLLRRTINEYVRMTSKFGFIGHYALKANSEPRIVQEMLNAGLGADCVSGNEVMFAIESGFSPDSIVFAGVGKKDKEIKYALEVGIHSFNCETIQEVEVVNEIAGEMEKKARVALRINPDVDAHTHKYITTGKRQNKFGVYETGFQEAIGVIKGCENVDFLGLHFHVGSQVSDMNVFKQLCLKVMEVQEVFETAGLEVREINLGGGLGVDYVNPKENSIAPLEEYFTIIHNTLKLRPEQKLHFESGRPLVGQSGTLISRALYVKHGKGVKFVILDAGMNDLIRPALYGAKHLVENLVSAGPKRRYDIVGPVCESSDTWGKNLSIPETKRGDLFAIHTAGAYGQVMAMTYNMKDLAKAYYSDEII